jgi:tetratricopeptide (TPR) repeat protein
MKIISFFKQLIGEQIFWLLVFILSLFLKSHVVIQVLLLLIMLLGLNQFKNLLLYWFYRLSKVSEIPFPWGPLKLPKDSAGELPTDLKMPDINEGNRRISYELFAKAVQTFSSGALPEAIALAEAAVERWPSNLEANVFLGFAYDLNPINKPEKAVYYSRQALNLCPGNFIPQFNLAVATNHVDGASKSLAEYLRAEQFAKDHKVDENSEVMGKLNLFIAHDCRDAGNLVEAKSRYGKAKDVFTKLVAQGLETSKHWLDAAEKGLKEIEEREKKQ